MKTELHEEGTAAKVWDRAPRAKPFESKDCSLVFFLVISCAGHTSSCMIDG